MIGKHKPDDAVTLIASGTSIRGGVQFIHQLYVNGQIEGDVRSLNDDEATVVIGESGSILGDVLVPNVVINGRVQGDVHASGRIELGVKSEVRGNVHYRLMEMHLGARVEGQLLHHAFNEERQAVLTGPDSSGAGDETLTGALLFGPPQARTSGEDSTA
ncbi:MAG: polymer-forming cytoskeletal protein [Gammaproteobacteria bacterium]